LEIGDKALSEVCRIIIASPHQRHDLLEAELRKLSSLEVMRVRGAEDIEQSVLRTFNPRYIFFAHWSKKIPQEVYSSFECVIFHMTDLPFGRGGSPLQNLIVRGIEATMLSAIRCVDDLDAGPVYLKQPLSTLGTAEEVYLRAADLMVDMILHIVTNEVRPIDQSGEVVVFKRRLPKDGDLSSARSLKQVNDLIRMLDAQGYPPAFLEIGKLRLQFSRSSLSPTHVQADVRIDLREEGGS
jgi:methionyl-tRNA formyltransferase